VRAFELRGADRKQVDELREQLLRLEEQVESTAQDVERLSEEQRFTTRLLSQRSDIPTSDVRGRAPQAARPAPALAGRARQLRQGGRDHDAVRCSEPIFERHPQLDVILISILRFQRVLGQVVR
jgi:hypothetical protein